MHYVYVLKNHQRKYYIGYSSDLKRRISEHAKHKTGFKLLYYEAYEHVERARGREQKLKHYGSAWRGLKMRLGF